MKNWLIRLIFVAFCLLLFYPNVESEESLLKENFNDLKNWKPLLFPKIKEHSSYNIETNGEEKYLKAVSKASASGMTYKKQFNVYEYPKIRWRWKVKNVYQKGDAASKKGDDYPIRVYIIFKYDPKKAGFVERAKYGTAKLLYGEYPPDSGINYIWANKKQKQRIITSAYTSKAKMIVTQAGKDKIGAWQEEEVNVLDDYRAAFGKEPPETASLAIMNDSDNTGEGSTSYVDYIEIFK